MSFLPPRDCATLLDTRWGVPLFRAGPGAQDAAADSPDEARQQRHFEHACARELLGDLD